MRWAAFSAWCLAVTILSSIPGQDTPRVNFQYSDKIAHFIMFFAGAFLLASALRHSFRWKPVAVIVSVTLTMAALGALDEWHQLSTPGRSGGDRGDWIADTVGGIFGVLGLYAFHGILRSFARPRTNPPAPRAN